MNRKVKVYRIIDGDTFTFLENEFELFIRVVDLDCFETRKGKRLNEQASKTHKTIDEAYIIAKETKNKAKELLLNQEVELEWTTKTNRPKRDTFGRFLARVYVNNKLYKDLMQDYNILTEIKI